jgi:hypothetical protein
MIKVIYGKIRIFQYLVVKEYFYGKENNAGIIAKGVQ